DEAAGILESQLAVDVPGGPVGRIDIQDDEVARVHEVGGDGSRHGRTQASASEVLVREHVADDRHTFEPGVDVGPRSGHQAAAVKCTVVNTFDDLQARVADALLVVQAVELGGVGLYEEAH